MSESPPTPPLFAIGTTVYARRDDRILILKRAVGAFVDSWILPGGALDPGETPEECAIRELEEESGLRADGPLAMIGAVPMHVYGHSMISLSYTCAVRPGDVVLSHEHSEARWITPELYRAEFFAEPNVAAIEARNQRVGRIVRGVQQDLDRYLRWLERERV